MRKLITIFFCVILANFIFLSIGFSQNSVGVSGYVPQTDKNINIKPELVPKATTKENKYLYFFEKFLSQKQQEESFSDNNKDVQSIYDRVACWGLMWGVLFVLAAIFLLILRTIDYYLIVHRHIR